MRESSVALAILLSRLVMGMEKQEGGSCDKVGVLT